MAGMADTRPDAPRYLREQGAQAADTSATVDVSELLTRLAERTEELAEARVRQKRAEANLKKKTRELDTERELRNRKRQQLETACRELEAECIQATEDFRALEAQLVREREARTAVQAELGRVQDRVAALQHQLQVAWTELKPEEAESGEGSWWDRSGS
jgi:chromosome segregation ATPase